MLRSRSPFTGLTVQEAKRLNGQLQGYVRLDPDRPGEDLAEIWHEEQEVLSRGTWLEPYLQGEAWAREVPRAIAMIKRELGQKAHAKVIRQQAKERHLDRQPATARQLKLLTRLTKRQDSALSGLSKLRASRLIQALLEASGSEPGRPREGGPVQPEGRAQA